MHIKLANPVEMVIVRERREKRKKKKNNTSLPLFKVDSLFSFLIFEGKGGGHL